MATVKKGMVTASPERKKHLNRTKRAFWKKERKAAKAVAKTAALPTIKRYMADMIKFPPRTTPLSDAELAGLEIPDFLKRAA